jgi:sugar/nucleoside kinase (ribokinase family)
LSLIDDCVDVLFGNSDELRSMYQVEHVDDAIVAAKSHCQIVAATRGPAGSTVVSNSDSVTVPAPPVPTVVDTTGAGDLYAAGVLAGLARNLPLDVCAQLGHLAAGEVISHLGARPEVHLIDHAKLILAESAKA